MHGSRKYSFLPYRWFFLIWSPLPLQKFHCSFIFSFKNFGLWRLPYPSEFPVTIRQVGVGNFFFNYTMKIRLSLVKMQGFFSDVTNIISCLFFCRSPKDGKKGLYVAENVLQFPVTAVGKRSEAKVKICNGSGDTQYLVIKHLLPQFYHF